jgi:hypothetical protein
MVRSDEKGPLSITRHYNTPSKKVLDLFLAPAPISRATKSLLFLHPAPESDSDFRLARRVHKT